MDADAFAAVHSPEWTELAALLRRRRLRGADADRFVLLYQRTATHLSLVRSSTADPALVGRLSTLVARSRSRLVAPREPLRAELVRFLVVSFPAALWRVRWPTAVSAAASIALAVVAAAWLLGDPHALAAVASPAQQRAYADHDFSSYYSDHPAQDFALRVWTNNAWITAQLVVLGVSGAWVVVALYQNALNLGVSAALMIHYHHGHQFFGLILPHGMLELTCVFVAAGAGARVFWAWVAPGPLPRSASLAAAGRSLVTIAVGLVGVLAVSGCLEAFLTPSGLPTPARIGVGAVVWAAFCTYATLLGRRAVAAGETGDLSAERAGAQAPVA